LLVAFFAAYMSTISTQLNWGAGYLVNDLYKRFMKPDETDAHYVMISRLATVLLGVVGMIVSSFISSISGAWGFIMQCGGGLGLVLILRWYWWRINAWSELAAMIAPVLISIPFFIMETPFEEALPITVLFTTIIWLLVTIFSAPTEQATLARFYKQVRPMGDWPESIGKPNNKALRHVAFQWLTAIVFTYSVLFMIGNMVLLQWGNAGILAAVVLLSGWLLKRGIDRMDKSEV
jgi:SSS family solute:Na+ symporter